MAVKINNFEDLWKKRNKLSKEEFVGEFQDLQANMLVEDDEGDYDYGDYEETTEVYPEISEHFNYFLSCVDYLSRIAG